MRVVYRVDADRQFAHDGPMLDIGDALNLILDRATPLAPVPTPLTPATLGRVLAEDVPADRDSPPWDKALMDGYAVRAADTPGDLRITGRIAAGDVPTVPLGPGEAARIFTGAPLPTGADAVVKQEDVDATDERVRVPSPVAVGRNMLPRGREMAAGEVVVPAGTVLTPAVLGLLAAVGRITAMCIPPARVGVLVTGNELVEANVLLGPGRIRNSNGPMLVAQAIRAGATATALGIAPDDPAELTRLVSAGLEASDVLLIAGGVSVGDFDLVPDVLRGLGVEVHFHTVRMKPGKPLLFGTRGNALVFGLPGNPVSGFVGFELFVRPALRKLAGYADDALRTTTAPLAEDFETENDRPTFHPAKLLETADGPRLLPLPWFGSADLRALLTADALLMLPAGAIRVPAGSPADALML